MYKEYIASLIGLHTLAEFYVHVYDKISQSFAKQEDNIDKIDISCPDQILKNWPLQK